MANVQITEELFLDLFKFFNVDSPDVNLYNKCKTGVNIKAEKINSRNLYTKYKEGKTTKEREEARQQYLDNRQINKDWRW